MNVDKLTSALGGMILSVENNPEPDTWLTEFLTELKVTLEGQQEDLVICRDYLDREKNRSYLLGEKVKQYEKEFGKMEIG